MQQLQIILSSLYNKAINKQQAYDLILSTSSKKKVETKSGTFFLTDQEIKQWENDGSFEKGDKVYATIMVKEY